MNRRFFRMAAVLAILFASAGLTVAEIAAATLPGAVTDPTNAVLTAATVQPINPDTGVTQTTVTNHAGLYSVSILPPGKPVYGAAMRIHHLERGTL